jgi:hypothetical protein
MIDFERTNPPRVVDEREGLVLVAAGVAANTVVKSIAS